MTNRNVLYRIFSAAGGLLYVGATVDPAARIMTHSHHQPWWDDAVSITMERFETLEELAAAEVAAIRSEKPTYNVIHNDKPPIWARKPRRPVGEGSVFQRGDGMWVATIDMPAECGQRRPRRRYAKDRHAALQKLEQLKRARDLAVGN